MATNFNIKEILSSDTDSQKVEKINYNFDQILANGGGEPGVAGATGPSGAVGATGPVGPVGPVGPQGPAGLSTDYFYKKIGPQVHTLFPSYDQANVTMVIGDNSVVDNVTTYPNIDAALKVMGDAGSGRKALRITDNSGGGYIDINYSEVLGTSRHLDFLPASTGGLTSHYKFVGQTLTLNNGADSVVLSTTLTEFNVDTVFTGNLKIDQPNQGNTNNYVLKSDAVGNASWQPLVTTPIGTMVMVPGFVLSNCVDWNGAGPNNPLSVDYIGKGINGNQYGDWRGWYFCYGKTWGSFATPNMLDRYPKGVNTTDGTGADASGGSASSAFSVNVPSHTHSITVDTEVQLQSGSGKRAAVASSNFNTTLPTNAGGSHTVSSSVTVDPKHITVGYMIYLGDNNLTYTTGNGGNVIIRGSASSSNPSQTSGDFSAILYSGGSSDGADGAFSRSVSLVDISN